MRITINHFLFLTVVLFSNPARAGTVTTTTDSGPGSLRAAISNAAPGETIDFAVSGTITLTSGELLILKDLTIRGPGSANLAIQRNSAGGTPNFRILNVFSGIVSISGLTMNNGHDNVGGGIQNETTLTLHDCVVLGNSATESGGGINNLSTLILSNCVISGNAVTNSIGSGTGGGLNNQGTATATRCRIASNFVTGVAGNASFGGGIQNIGTLAITNSVITANTCLGSSGGSGGGGGVNNDGTLVLHTSTVSSNSAISRAFEGVSQGGGIANGFGTVTLDRTTVAYNSAGIGGGSHGRGGGIFNNVGTLDLESSTVSGNSAIGALPPPGGGILNGTGSVRVNRSTITANDLTGSGGISKQGSGMANLGGVVELKNTILAGNKGDSDLHNIRFEDFHSGGFNLFGFISGIITPGTNDQLNITAEVLRVSALQDNGGPTFTHALLCGSPAINAGDKTGASATDQRGFVRTVGGVMDIGSFEGGNTAPVIRCHRNETLICAPPTGQTATVSVGVADADGDPLVVIWAVDGVNYQTNHVRGVGRPTNAQIEFTATYEPGLHEVTVTVTDSQGCSAACFFTVTVPSIPTITCSGSITSNCAQPVTISVSVADADGDALVVVWTVDGTPVQTNSVTGSGRVDFTVALGVGTHSIAVSVADTDGCGTTCTTTLIIVPLGDLYPIALHKESLLGLPVGGIIPDIYNGVQPGNFGWLTWAGSPSEPTLATSLTPPGNSSTYVNPLNRKDHTVSVGDWVQGKPGISNSSKVRDALDTLKQIDIVVPVWDRASGRGNKSLYRVAGFARVRITDYRLPKQNRITARFLGFVDCQ